MCEREDLVYPLIIKFSSVFLSLLNFDTIYYLKHNKTNSASFFYFNCNHLLFVVNNKYFLIKKEKPRENKINPRRVWSSHCTHACRRDMRSWAIVRVLCTIYVLLVYKKFCIRGTRTRIASVPLSLQPSVYSWEEDIWIRPKSR